MAGLKSFSIFVGLEFGGHFLFFCFGNLALRCHFCKQNFFFLVSMDSIADFFYKRTSVFGRFNRRLLLCVFY